MEWITATRKRTLQVLRVIIVSALLCSCTARTPLHDAAVRGDVTRIDQYVKKGIPVNQQDAEGNTPLHYAYYHGQKEAVDRLTSYGASLTVRNYEGDTPLDMEKIAKAESLIRSGARLLNATGGWTDAAAARPLYNQLKAMDGTIVTKAIVRKAIRDENRLRVLFLAVKLGIPSSEHRLNDALQAYGDKSMAEDYLNSGSSSLYEGGRRWANSHGYYISTGMGSHRVAWGRF